MDAILLRAYLAAYRDLTALEPGAEVEPWLAERVRAACALPPDEPLAEIELWPRLRAALAAEAPALSAPELPGRRFPVVPRLQRRRRGKGHA